MNPESRYSWRLLLLPLAWLYGMGIWIRNNLYDRGFLVSTRFNLPIISIGNISAGGTGKTPHVEYLVDLLKNEFHLATLSRGYLRKTRDFRIASSSPCTQEIGDEPCQIKRRFPEITVAVDRKRVHGISELLKLSPPVELVILDDAFQHRSLQAGFSILLINYLRPITGDMLIPAGRLREPATGRKRADMILITKSPEDINPIRMKEYEDRLGLELGKRLFFTTMRYGPLVPVFRDSTGRDPGSFMKQALGVLLVTGVVDPGNLRAFAQRISEKVETIRFPDHHRYRMKDIKKIQTKAGRMGVPEDRLLILTTEKDAVKLEEMDFPEIMKASMFAVRLEVHFLNNDRTNFENQIRKYVTGNS